MTNEIERKLRLHLRKGMGAECDIVYFMIQTRKLLEQEQKQDQYQVVNFYCNWVAHPKLKQSAFATKLVRIFDDIHRTERIPAQLDTLIGDAQFNQELKAFLTQHNIPTTLCTNRSRWLNFLYHLSKVIADCPLFVSLKENAKSKTAYVDSVKVVVTKPRVPNSVFALEWVWTFHTIPPKGDDWLRITYEYISRR